MIIAKTNLAKNIPEKKQDFFLKKFKKNSKYVFKLKIISNDLKTRNDKIRLRYLEEYIKDAYKINIDIYNIIYMIIDNIKYSLDRNYLIIDDYVIIDKVPLITLVKLILYGTIDVKGSSVLKSCLVEGYNLLKVQNMLISWGI